jgi:hypothetical protein
MTLTISLIIVHGTKHGAKRSVDKYLQWFCVFLYVWLCNYLIVGGGDLVLQDAKHDSLKF